MWTEITRGQYERSGLRYASDLTDEEWTVIAPYLPARQVACGSFICDLLPSRHLWSHVSM